MRTPENPSGGPNRTTQICASKSSANSANGRVQPLKSRLAHLESPIQKPFEEVEVFEGSDLLQIVIRFANAGAQKGALTVDNWDAAML